MNTKELQKKHYDNLADDYSKRINEESYKYYFEFTKDIITNTLSNYFKDINKCKGLDIGCGNGDITAEIKKLCKMMVGTDISDGMISSARKLHKELKFFSSPSDELMFKDSQFDFSTTIHLLHHLADDELMNNTISEMKRVTKNKGLIITIDVNRLNPLSGLMQSMMVKRGVDTGKEKLVFPKQIINLFKKHNIKLLKYKGFCLIPHFFPKLKKINPFLEKIPILNKIMAKDYMIVGQVIK